MEWYKKENILKKIYRKVFKAHNFTAVFILAAFLFVSLVPIYFITKTVKEEYTNLSVNVKDRYSNMLLTGIIKSIEREIKHVEDKVMEIPLSREIKDMIAQYYSQANINKENTKNILNRYFHEKMPTYKDIGAVILSTQFEVLCDMGEKEVSAEELDIYTKAISNHPGKTLWIVTSVNNEERLVFINPAVYEETQEVLLYIIISMQETVFSTILMEASIDESVGLYIVDIDGNILSGREPKDNNFSEFGDKELRKSVVNNNMTGKTVSIKSNSKLFDVFFLPLQNSNWFVVCVEPSVSSDFQSKKIVDKIDQLALKFSVVSIFIAIIATTLIMTAISRLRRKLKELPVKYINILSENNEE